MAYGRIYIDNLRNKVIALFDELKKTNELNEEHFIERFKVRYPKDYASLQYEWEYKTHEFKKNRKGQPKHIPLRPDKILSNMYKNYHYKLIKAPSIKKHKQRTVNSIRAKIGNLGLQIKADGNGKYNVIEKSTKRIIYESLTVGELKEIYSYEKVSQMFKDQKNRKKSEVQNNDKS